MYLLTSPPSIDWELTSKCNHNCIHCYNYWRKQDHFEIARSENYYLSVAERIIRDKPVSVQLTGGEPLLVWANALPAIQRLIEAGIYVSINTNATLVNCEIASFMALHGIEAFVSFPCAEPDVFDHIVNKRGAFSLACEGIHKMINAGVQVSLNMVVTKINFPYVYKTAEFIKREFGCGYFSATKASFPQNADAEFRGQMLDKEEFNVMLKELLRVKQSLSMRVDSAWVYSLCGYSNDEVRNQFGYNRKCYCGKYSFVIDADGYIKACGCSSKSYGSIFETRFSEAIALMNEWRDGSLLPSLCKKCKWLAQCGGGCRSDAFSTNGEYCSMDSTADPSMTADDITLPERKAAPISLTTPFSLNPECKFKQEGTIVRLSYKTNYCFVSQKFTEFLEYNESFTGEELQLQSGAAYPIIENAILVMLSKHILINGVSVSNKAFEQGAFSLLERPYNEENDPEWLKRYTELPDSNVRHFI